MKQVIRDHLIYKHQAASDYKWVKGIDRAFRRLQSSKSLVIVQEYSDFRARPSYLDISILLPKLFGRKEFRWVFTVSNVYSFMIEKSIEDIQTELWHHAEDRHPEIAKKILHIDSLYPDTFWPVVNEHIDTILSDPIIEFDDIWTKEHYFVKEDVIKYTKLWLQKFYPELAKREIIFQS